jgi:uncharacterized membrane protein
MEENNPEHLFPRPETLKMKYRETSIRSLCKAVSWRIFGSIGTATLVFFVTGSLKGALTVGIADFVAKIGLYYVHERLWDAVPIGRVVSDSNSSDTVVRPQSGMGRVAHERASATTPDPHDDPERRYSRAYAQG